MMPRAVSPARASPCAAGLSDARLAFMRTCAAEVDSILLSTFDKGRKTYFHLSWIKAGKHAPARFLAATRNPASYQEPHSSRGSGSDGGVRKAGAPVRSSAL